MSFTRRITNFEFPTYITAYRPARRALSPGANGVPRPYYLGLRVICLLLVLRVNLRVIHRGRFLSTRRSFGLSVLGCIEADLCKKIFILQRFSFSRSPHLCIAPILKRSQTWQSFDPNVSK